MNESFTIEGFWWLPVSPEVKIPGILSYKPGDTPRLRLMGTLNQPKEIFFMHTDFINPALILGKSSNGESITLSKCLQINGTTSVVDEGLQSTSEFIAHFAFFGVHFLVLDDIRFISISVRLQGLDSWYNKDCIEISNSSEKNNTIRLKIPDPLVTKLKDYDIKVICTSNRKFSLNSATIHMGVHLEISSKDDKPFESFMKNLRLIQNFFSFLISDPTFVIEMTGRLTISEHIPKEKYSSSQTIRIFYPAAGWQSNPHDDSWAYMLLPFKDVENNFSDLLSNWAQKSEVLKPVIDLFFAGIYLSSYPENEFLNLIQAIETYHRRIVGGEYQPEVAFLNGLYKLLVEAIPQDVSSDFRSSLQNGKLRYAYEFSLRKRLLLICEHISEIIQINFLINHKAIANFAERISNTRNYLTHYSHELKELAITDGYELSVVNYQLRLIISICFLEQLGVPYDKLRKIVSNHGVYKNFLT